MAKKKKINKTLNLTTQYTHIHAHAHIHMHRVLRESLEVRGKPSLKIPCLPYAHGRKHAVGKY